MIPWTKYFNYHSIKFPSSIHATSEDGKSLVEINEHKKQVISQSFSFPDGLPWIYTSPQFAISPSRSGVHKAIIGVGEVKIIFVIILKVSCLFHSYSLSNK